MSRPAFDRHDAPRLADRAEPPHPTQPPAWDWDWDDYLYPLAETGGAEVLRNNLGLRTERELRFAERVLSAGRQLELAANPDLIPRTFDLAHWQAIHGHLFGDIYPWAGQFRTVDIAKGDGLGNQHPFLDAEHLHSAAADLLGPIRAQDMFAGRPRNGVLAGLTVTLQTTNFIHPFREGNGRVQRVLAEHIAEQAGYHLDWSQIASDEQHAAMVMTYLDQPGYLYDALDRALHDLPNPARSPGLVSDPGPGLARWHFAKDSGQILAEARAQAAASPADTSAQPAVLDPAPQAGHQAGGHVELGD